MFKKSLFVLLASFLLFSVIACAPVEEGTELVDTVSDEKVPVVIYAEEVDSVDVDGRNWPTVNIFKKTGNNLPELLLENVGKVGEYPNSYMLYPDKSKLLINLESKLQVYDFADRSLKDIFIPKKQVESFIFSEDGDELLIWDQIYASNDDFGYFLDKLNLDTGEVETLVSGDTDGKYMFLSNWRDDGVVLLYQALGEASAPWYMNLADGELMQPPIEDLAGLMNGYSRNGTYLIRVDEWVDDICNDFMGRAPSIYGLYNPVSGERMGGFGVEGRASHVVSFSPDDDQVLLKTFDPWAGDYTHCAEMPEEVYYFADLPTYEAPELMEDYMGLYNEWNSDEGFRKMNYDTGGVTISLDGEEVFHFNNYERVIDVYFE